MMRAAIAWRTQATSRMTTMRQARPKATLASSSRLATYE
jgi:hypothetical protein